VAKKSAKVREKCSKCGSKLTLDNEMRMVMDLTYHSNRRMQYRTWRTSLCVDCLKEFAPMLKQFGFERNEDYLDLGLT